MRRCVSRTFALVPALLLVAGCATRPVNPPITGVEASKGYRYLVRAERFPNKQALVVLAFSGGGTRAAAFSYGVLEALRRTEVAGPKGEKGRLLDYVDVITGVSGGSFTALAYGLYGEKLFDQYERAFLKRNVQGELIGRFFDPGNWGALWSESWGRSEMAAQLYDEILFHGATFADLERGSGPFILASATDISTGGRIVFQQGVFDILCSDLGAVPLSRAAAASSAVPFALSPVTLNNYGGSCHYETPRMFTQFRDPATAPRPAARATRELQDLQALGDGTLRPYIHLVDGGLADNIGVRGVLSALEELEALHDAGVATPLDDLRRVVVVIVNSVSAPKTNWDASERPPSDVAILIKATGVPIDRYSYEGIELLKDIGARWQTMRRIRRSPALDLAKDPALAPDVHAPDIDIYAIDVSFAALKNIDSAEFDYLNSLPTSFVLPDEAVDRLRAAAGRILLDSPDFRRLLKDVGARVNAEPAAAAAAAQ
jgi:NTE family protein